MAHEKILINGWYLHPDNSGCQYRIEFVGGDAFKLYQEQRTHCLKLLEAINPDADPESGTESQGKHPTLRSRIEDAKASVTSEMPVSNISSAYWDLAYTMAGICKIINGFSNDQRALYLRRGIHITDAWHAANILNKILTQPSLAHVSGIIGIPASLRQGMRETGQKPWQDSQ